MRVTFRPFVRLAQWVASPRGRWIAGSLLLAGVVFWELHYLHKASFQPPPGIWAPPLLMYRTLLAGLWAATLAVGFGRLMWWIWAPLMWLINLGLLTYVSYFDRPLSLLSVWRAMGESQAGVRDGFELIPLKVALILGVALALKLALVFLRGRSPFRLRVHGLGMGIGIVLYAGIVAWMATHGETRFSFLKTKADFNYMGYAYGYTVPWVAEFEVLDDNVLLDRAVALRAQYTDVLSSVEAPLPLGDKVVILQVEAMGWDLVGYEHDGQPVMPFINSLMETSEVFRMQTRHVLGSADADFSMLEGHEPSTDVITYRIANYPYENSLPTMFRAAGYRTMGFHGVTGEFFNRRAAWQQMGFDEIYFLEELRETVAKEKLTTWGVQDEEFLQEVAREVSEADDPVCAFAITVSSHMPFQYIPKDARELVAEPGSLYEWYVDAMRYVDRCLEQFFAALPDGVTVVMYGDHTSGLTEEERGYRADRRPDGRECVPCLIHRTGENLAFQQVTRETELALSGDISLLDVSHFLRGHLVRQDLASIDPDTPGETARQ